MLVEALSNLEEIGIYEIRCLKNNKVYIGSTSLSFKKRMWQHSWKLRVGKHKNKYLQNSYNKYGADAFKFKIIEVVDNIDILFEREQYHMDREGVGNKSKCFNINLFATGGNQISKESVVKRSKSLKVTNDIAKCYYEMIEASEICLEDVPDKYKRTIEYRYLSKRSAWNKGKTIQKGYDYSHLKGVKKTLTHRWDARSKAAARTIRDSGPNINIFNALGEFITQYPSAKDIEDIGTDHGFPLIISNINGRNGRDPKVLKSQNIGHCCRGKVKHYKGLIFKFSNDETDIIPLTLDDFKRKNSQGKYYIREHVKAQYSRLVEQSANETFCEFRESPGEGNPEPSTLEIK